MQSIRIPGYTMFDTHKYIKKLQSRGFKEAQAASIVELFSECKEHDISHLVKKADMKSELANVKSEFKSEIASAKVDIIKWMFSFFAGIMLAVVGLWFK